MENMIAKDLMDLDATLVHMTPTSIAETDDMIPLHTSHPAKAENDEVFASDSSTSSSSPSKPAVSRARAKKLRKTALQTQPQSSKPFLRPANDVLFRIRHDPALKESDYVVGYRDRHTPKVMELDVSEWKGGGDVTHEEWIPQHRILYFRKKGNFGEKRIWDREKRLDRFFGSGVDPAAEAPKAEEEVHSLADAFKNSVNEGIADPDEEAEVL